MTIKHYTYAAKLASNEVARTIEFVISTPDQDRVGDTIDPAGWQLERYRSNPVVLWGHKKDVPPIGKAVSVGVQGRELVAVAQFATAEEHPLADTVYRLYKGG